jgi:uncharacterized integral membrane protein
VTTHDPLEKPPAKPVDKRERARRIAALVIAALVIVLAVANLDEVTVHWVVATTRTPLIVVIAVSFVLGLGGGYLLRGRRAAGRADKHR